MGELLDAMVKVGFIEMVIVKSKWNRGEKTSQVAV